MIRSFINKTLKTYLPVIKISKEFKDCWNVIKSGNPIIFITGKAGTGKSTFLQYALLRLKRLNKNVVVVAPTGVAALNVKGQTIHKFFGFPPKTIDLDSIRKLSSRELYEKLDVLIIDEVSMVRADLFDAIERFLRLNGPDPDLPFGGVQIILVGDLFQLSPIVNRSADARLFGSKYKSEFFFDAHCMSSCDLIPLELTKAYRHEDQHFVNILDRIRYAENHRSSVAEVNRTCFLRSRKDLKQAITLTCTNKVADDINYTYLENITKKEYVFEGSVDGRFNIKDDRLPSPYTLRLKLGAQVMFTKNDSKKRWVNGTIGIVKKLSDKLIYVEIEDNNCKFIYSVQRTVWESYEHKYDYEHRKVISEVIGKYVQFPLMLAWAVTIHKSQGKTLSNVLIDLGSGAFTHGQVYVALSRCRSLFGISLVNPIKMSDIKCHERVKQFYNNFLQIGKT